MEHECVIDKFRSSEALCVHHLLKRINALTWRRGDDTCAGRGVPYSEANRDHSGGNGTQTDLAHPKIPQCFDRNMRSLWGAVCHGWIGLMLTSSPDRRPATCIFKGEMAQPALRARFEAM